eukprot:Rmarinus@m.24001
MGNAHSAATTKAHKSRIQADETVAFAATYIHHLTQVRTARIQAGMSRDDFELLSQKSLEMKLSLFGGAKKRKRSIIRPKLKPIQGGAMSSPVSQPTGGTECPSRTQALGRMKTSMSNPQFCSSPEVRLVDARFLTPPVALPRYGAVQSPHNARLRKKRLCGLFLLPDGARATLMQRHAELLQAEGECMNDICSYWSLCCLVRRIVRFTHVEALVVGLILLERLTKKKVVILPSNRCLHLFIAALLAYKYLDDCPYDNAVWAKYVGLDVWSTKAVNVYEVVFLQRLQWRLSVSKLEYVDFVGRALKQVLGISADIRNACPGLLNAEHEQSLEELEEGLRALVEVVHVTASCRTRVTPVPRPPPAILAPPSIV